MNAFLPSEDVGKPPRVMNRGLPVAAPRPTYGPLPEELQGRSADVDAVYVHVPFCATKCHYCDFYSLAGHLDEVDAYLGALEEELRMQREFFGKPRPRTIFVGGGTPTLMELAEMERFLKLMTAFVDRSQLEEWTIEANPNTFDREKAKLLASYGVNRISFGAQSFMRGELEMLQRDHDPESVEPAFQAARDAGIVNVSVDLIFGIPGQTVESWEYSLGRALALEPMHMSCYSLTYEPNTAMTARMRRGEFKALDEETELRMFEHVYERLRGAGFERYETSNYARVEGEDGALAPPVQKEWGWRCRHNLAYWKGENWLAVGPSAGGHFAPHGKVQCQEGAIAWQWKNVGSLAHYLEALLPAGGAAGTPLPKLPVVQMEALERREWAAGVAVFWLRLAEGLDYAAFRERTGIEARGVMENVLRKYEEIGLVALTDERARILEKGVAVSNRMLGEVLAGFGR
jgi:oxygen-independent coproporphyrinogen-3 oxidase